MSFTTYFTIISILLLLFVGVILFLAAPGAKHPKHQ
jgi:hypothetical protein